MPREVPEALGGGLGTIVAPKDVPGTPGHEQMSKRSMLDPPRDPVGIQNSDFLSIPWVLFPIVSDCCFGRSSGQFLKRFGEVCKDIFDYFVMIFDVNRKL